MSRCACSTQLHKGDDVYVSACGCTGYLQYTKVSRVFVKRVWLDRPIDVARCAKDMQRRRFLARRSAPQEVPYRGTVRR